MLSPSWLCCIGRMWDLVGGSGYLGVGLLAYDPAPLPVLSLLCDLKIQGSGSPSCYHNRPCCCAFPLIWLCFQDRNQRILPLKLILAICLAAATRKLINSSIKHHVSHQLKSLWSGLECLTCLSFYLCMLSYLVFKYFRKFISQWEFINYHQADELICIFSFIGWCEWV